MAAILISIASQWAWAVVINYPDMNGIDVMFLDISEDTFTEPTALFGTPSVQGNRLDFDPVSFAATSNTSSGTTLVDTVNGQLNFTVMSNVSSFPLERIIIDEAGDYALTGLGNVTAEVTLTAPVDWRITHVDGSPLAIPLGGTTNLVFTPSDSFALPDRGGSWNGQAEIDLVAELSNANVAGNATKVEISLLSTLTATAANGGSAFIAKKDVGGLTISVPEPAAVFVPSILLCLLPLSRRFRRQTNALNCPTV